MSSNDKILEKIAKLEALAKNNKNKNEKQNALDIIKELRDSLSDEYKEEIKQTNLVKINSELTKFECLSLINEVNSLLPEISEVWNQTIEGSIHPTKIPDLSCKDFGICISYHETIIGRFMYKIPHNIVKIWIDSQSMIDTVMYFDWRNPSNPDVQLGPWWQVFKDKAIPFIKNEIKVYSDSAKAELQRSIKFREDKENKAYNDWVNRYGK